MKHRAKIIGAAALCLAVGSEALTLGSVRGAVLIGRPLDVSVQVQMDAGEDASSLCFDAEVFHADTRQEASQVRVVTEAVAQTQMVNVRIVSSAVIDEPVVTVYLRTGCGQKTTRRYVLLADLPSEVVAPSIPAASYAAPMPARPSAQAAVAAPAAVVKAKTVRVPRHTGRRVAKKRPEAKMAADALKQTSSGERDRGGRTAGQPRLKLDTLELASPVAAPLAVPALPPESTVHDVQRMQTLEGDVKALLALAAKNEASLVDLRVRLQKAESERFPAGLVYALVALVLASLAAVAALWHRQRRARAGGEDWWSASIAPPEPVPGSGSDGAVRAGAWTAQKVRPAAFATDAGNSGLPSSLPSDIDVSMVEISESRFNNFLQSDATHSAIRRPPPPPPPAPPAPPAPPGALGQAGRVPADASPGGMHFPPVLDLDLSEVGTEGLAANPASTADVDLPLLPSVELRSGDLPATTEASGQDGNLIDFDMPQAAPADKRPG